MKRSYPVKVLWCPNLSTPRKDKWSFPRNVEKRIQSDCTGYTVLHLFGGKARFGTRLDIDIEVKPDVIGDAWLPPFAEQSFDVVVIDAPYKWDRIGRDQQFSLFRAAAFIARKRVIWFANVWAAQFSVVLRPERAWLVRVGDNCFVRSLQYFRVVGRTIPTKQFQSGPAMKYNRWLVQPRSLAL